MHDELWAGVQSKVENAAFHWQRMAQSLQPPERTGVNVALQSSGAIIDTGWQRAFYAHLDAFLSAARSVPEIIQCCFGKDLGHPEMKAWFDGLDGGEQDRRQQFTGLFRTAYKKFHALDLGKARHISEHRAGYAPVEVEIRGFFGVIYKGGPIKTMPLSETRTIDDLQYAFLAKPVPVQPSWQDFKIDGKPLFRECEDYLKRAQDIIQEARTICSQVHGEKGLTSPPQ
jgi:hypothetical protein